MELISQCTCGREKQPQHCVRCGSKVVYRVQRLDKVQVVNNEKFRVLGFSCRRCGLEFNEDMPCSAPQKGSKRVYNKKEPTKQSTGLLDLSKVNWLVKRQQSVVDVDDSSNISVLGTECPFCSAKEQQPRNQDEWWECSRCHEKQPPLGIVGRTQPNA